jgi:hypothetical protein
MAFREEWTPTGPPLTIADLYAQNPGHCFQDQGRIYVFIGVDGSQPSAELHYLATEHNSGVPTRFLGSALVTPVAATETPLF